MNRAQKLRKALGPRQTWLLSAFLERHLEGIRSCGQSLGFVPTSVPPRSTFYGDAPPCIGMTNVRGLQKRGLIHEPKEHFFYLSDTGKIACEQIFPEFFAEREREQKK